MQLRRTIVLKQFSAVNIVDGNSELWKIYKDGNTLVGEDPSARNALESAKLWISSDLIYPIVDRFLELADRVKKDVDREILVFSSFSWYNKEFMRLEIAGTEATPAIKMTLYYYEEPIAEVAFETLARTATALNKIKEKLKQYWASHKEQILNEVDQLENLSDTVLRVAGGDADEQR